jgi:hypothetical protein
MATLTATLLIVLIIAAAVTGLAYALKHYQTVVDTVPPHRMTHPVQKEIQDMLSDKRYKFLDGNVHYDKVIGFVRITDPDIRGYVHYIIVTDGEEGQIVDLLAVKGSNMHRSAFTQDIEQRTSRLKHAVHSIQRRMTEEDAN